jgi:hypothetical protein
VAVDDDLDDIALQHFADGPAAALGLRAQVALIEQEGIEAMDSCGENGRRGTTSV